MSINERDGHKTEVVGADRLPVTGLAVLAPNHASVLDGIILGETISRELRFVAKADLWQFRLLARMLHGLGAIRIERGRSGHRALAQVRQALDAEQAVVFFPQGAVRGDRVWHRGAARMAFVTGARLCRSASLARHELSAAEESASRNRALSLENRSKSRVPRQIRSRRQN